jgi:hypothetical protein
VIGGSSIPDIRPVDLQDPSLFRLNQAIRLLAERLAAVYDMQTYANNAAAVAGGLKPGWMYKTVTGEVRVVI